MSFGSRFLKGITPSGAARARNDRQPEHEERVRQQRADDGRLRDHELARGNREQDDEELRQVPERRLQDARHSRAEPLSDRLGGDRDHPGEAGERRGREDEDRDSVAPA